MAHDIKFYAILSILAVISIACILTLNVILILFGLIFTGLLIAFYKLDYVFESMIFKRTNLVQVLDGCELAGDRTAAIRRIGNGFCAIAAASLLNNSNESLDREKIENIIANSHCTFKFVMQVERLDMKKLLERLQTNRNMKEIELDRLKNDSRNNASKTNNLKRQIELVEHEIERISAGGIPLKVAQYIMTSAISQSRIGAQEAAKSQLRELAGEFGALLGAKSEMLSGNELLQLLKFDSGIQ